MTERGVTTRSQVRRAERVPPLDAVRSAKPAKHEMSSHKLWTGNILNLKERSGFATRRCEKWLLSSAVLPKSCSKSPWSSKSETGTHH